MILQDLDHLENVSDANQITGGTYTKVQAIATATARGQYTYTTTRTVAISYSGGYQKSS